MAKLELRMTEIGTAGIELKPGTNRLGRAPGNDVCLPYPGVSSTHCELEVGCGRISVRDCGSTNGTFLDGTPVREAILLPGQTLRLGDLELLVANTEIPVTIPKFEINAAVPPAVRPDGSVLCPRHREHIVAYRCSHCRELLCEECLHRLRRRGGNFLCLCPRCSFPVEPLADPKRKKPSLLRRLRETTRLVLSRAFCGR